MPVNLSDIAEYHRRQAALHLKMAKAARGRHNETDAMYHERLALRYTETAQEQDHLKTSHTFMSAPRAPVRKPAKPLHSRPASRPSFALRGLKHLAEAIRRSFRGTAPLEIELTSE